MKKRNKIIAIILAAGIIVGIYVIRRNQYAEAQAQVQAQEAYYYQAEALRLDKRYVDYFRDWKKCKYVPYPKDYKYAILRYADLAYYRKTTGNILNIDDVKDYLSQEYEEDGEVRIYTNGRHPEIQAYIEWRQYYTVEKEIDTYTDELITIFSDYKRENYFDKGLESPFPIFSHLSFEQLDELIKKEADPAYEMQLEP